MRAEQGTDEEPRRQRAERYRLWRQAQRQTWDRPPLPEGPTPCCANRWVWSAETRGHHDGSLAWRCLHCNEPHQPAESPPPTAEPDLFA
jgi:hypothetical protein